ncbi:Mut7-C RNAse domain-containing protein [Leifsonia sp. YAF41]|uniref:Mut7-C RNAse domain-containing protein n=1 Tax=Leifsonia sp. YAF41 TaxID=3233086 RepID=UPI003F97D7DC
MPQVTVNVDLSLRSLLPRRDRGDHVVRDAAPTETVAHLLQVLGVPVTEVGSASVDGHKIGHEALRTTHIGNSSAVDVESRERPQPSSGLFLLDVHLGTLTRRMRLLGLDAAYEPDDDDSKLAARSATEQRELLTRDRGLLFRKTVHDGALIRSGDVDAQLDDVLSRFAPRLAPWTRCLRCGALLAEVPAAEVAAQLEPGTLRTYRSFSRCTNCDWVYWRGAHSQRLEALVRQATRHEPGVSSSR